MTLWDCLIHPRPWDDPRFFAGAPVYQQAKRIWWQDLKALTPKPWIEKISESDLMIQTKWGAELWVLGLDVAARIEGTPWDGGVIDELANCKPGAWDANIRPALSDRAGWAWLIGVPDMDAPGQIEYEQMYHVARSGVDPEWDAFEWPSADILPAAEVESAKRRMDRRLFDQEYGGKFILAGGRAFPDFDTKLGGRNIRTVAYDPNLPICWALDFNIDPMCSGIIQHHKGKIRVVGELTLPDTQTDRACDHFLELAENRHWNLSGMYVYGDASGEARDSTSGKTDWHIIRHRLKNIVDVHWRVPRSNPPLKDTVNAVNAKVMAADGSVSLTIDPSCEQLITDMRSALWPSDLPEHCLAWLRYFVHREYPIRPPGSNQPHKMAVAHAG